MKKILVTMVGTGAVASAIVRQMSRRRMPIQAIIGTTPRKARLLGREVGCSRTGADPSLALHSHLIVFAVPDTQIAEIASHYFPLRFSNKRVAFAHTSGSLTAAAFDRPSRRSPVVSLASMHPLQTFASRRTSPALNHVTMGIEGEKPALRFVRQFSKQLGCRPVTLTERDKLKYHMAAIFASNFLVGLQYAAHRLYHSIGLSSASARHMLRPLIDQSLANMDSSPILSALTGPASRGDHELIERHIIYLKRTEPALAPVYAALSQYCMHLAGKTKL